MLLWVWVPHGCTVGAVWGYPMRWGGCWVTWQGGFRGWPGLGVGLVWDCRDLAWAWHGMVWVWQGFGVDVAWDAVGLAWVWHGTGLMRVWQGMA